eukprot:scaffold88251_cov105-Phaeocystis_antarctica.AAC.1
MAGAHVSGTGWRLPGCEKTFFGAISTCASASSQRCHVRVRLRPCAVASCCLPWCLAVMPVRGRCLTRPDIATHHRAAPEVAQKGRSEVVSRAQYAARRLVLVKANLPKGTGGLTGHHHASRPCSTDTNAQ